MNLLKDRFYKTSIVVYLLVNCPANTDTNKNCNIMHNFPNPNPNPNPVGMAAISLCVTVCAVCEGRPKNKKCPDTPDWIPDPG